MSLAVAIQMDPIESINIDADSTFVLALETNLAAMACSITCRGIWRFATGGCWRGQPLQVRRDAAITPRVRRRCWIWRRSMSS
jgi:glutathione synthase